MHNTLDVQSDTYGTTQNCSLDEAGMEEPLTLHTG